MQLVLGGMGLGRSYDVHNLGILQRPRQGNDVSVSLGSHNLLSHCRVDLVGKVHRRRASRQLHHIALWGKHKDGVPQQLLPNLAEQNLIRQLLRLQLLQLIDDGQILQAHPVGTAQFLLVQQVACHTIFSHGMHLGRPNLYFQRTSLAHHCRVETLVTVGFGHGNIVLEPSIQGLPQAVDKSHQHIAITAVFTEHPQGQQVKKLLHTLVPLAHFLINRIKMLCPAGNAHLNSCTAGSLVNFLLGLGQIIRALLLLGSHHLLDLGIHIGI